MGITGGLSPQVRPTDAGHAEEHVDVIGIEAEQVWFGPADRPLYGWVAAPRGGLVRGAVLLCPPLGEEGRGSHRTFRRLVEQLAATGFLALRFDYDGTGDSAGLQTDPGRVSAWLDSVRAARAFLERFGTPRVDAVGMRMGATLAAFQAATDEAPFDAIALWDPCSSGRTFIREGQALYTMSGGEAYDDDQAHTPGFRYARETVTDLRRVSLAALPSTPGRRVLLLERPDRPLLADAVAGVHAVAPDVVVDEAVGQADLLDTQTHWAAVPTVSSQRVVDWLASGAGPATTRIELPQSHEASLGAVRETARFLAGGHVYGVLTEPERGTHRAGPVVVLVPPANEHHIGPGRIWVEFARAWAAAGARVLRIDQSGVGDAPTRPGEPDGLTFSPHWNDDIRALAEELAGDGAPVVMSGVCSGAYVALEAGATAPVDAVLAINPRLTMFEATAEKPRFRPEGRRAAVVPHVWAGRLWTRRPALASAVWRLYRQLAFWHAPILALRRVVRNGTRVRVLASARDNRHFREVLLWRLLPRRSDPELLTDPAMSHELLTAYGQDRVYRWLSDFLSEEYGLPVAPSR